MALHQTAYGRLMMVVGQYEPFYAHMEGSIRHARTSAPDLDRTGTKMRVILRRDPVAITDLLHE
jgi:hypothetical protein